ncbi:hypothetical protein E8M24_08460 [Bacillus thuringiensis]|uniref:hypothetical protein n=1 Tax=Bacillus TaxID=1386 RepID=UPI00125FF987|nr:MULTISPECIES: hypothetical protein [Bacillus]KAB5654603.1 hypothetical protein E8M24_08460 [Bacillus thuringiensis]MDK3010854.1 hypothetical protein [Bacillus sp. RB3]MDZ4442427.1 hypothetical protein [Bacillus cereus]HDR5271801.1 hypothetical protein [Bacillus thuringiensis]
MEFYKVSFCGDQDIKVILANSKYEAAGYYLMQCHNGSGFMDDVVLETMAADEKIEVSCVGFPVYKTLEELYKEKEFGDTPCVIVGLAN